MSLRPTTQLLDLSYDDWPTRPTEVACVACNREGKWSDTLISYLEVPCYECAKRNQFLWYSFPCNGAIQTSQEELESETPELGFIGEYTTHEIVMKVIDDIYSYGVSHGTFMPTDSSFTTMDNVLHNLYNNHFMLFNMRIDVQHYINAIWNEWDSLGNWPNIDVGDHEHEIRFFKETFRYVLPEYESSTIVGIEEDLTGINLLIEEDSEEDITQPNEDQGLRKKACYDGIEILEKIMEKDERMKEEDYRQLMNIFKTIHDN